MRSDLAAEDKPGKQQEFSLYLLNLAPDGTVVLAKSGDAHLGSYIFWKRAPSNSEHSLSTNEDMTVTLVEGEVAASE